jgi:hypothetical protein
MPRGASPKREREYKEIEAKFEKEGRYKGREEEVAARIVNKQRKEAGETESSAPAKKAAAKKTAAPKSTASKSTRTPARKPAAKARKASGADDSVPIRNYEKLTVPEVRSAVADLSAAQRSKVRRYETSHKNRKGVLQALDRAH